MSRGRLLTLHQAGESSGFGQRMLRRLLSEGRIPYLQPHGKGGKVWIAEDDLAAFIDNERRHPVRCLTADQLRRLG